MKTKKSFILSIIITILTTIVLFASEVNATSYGLNQAETIKNNGKIGDTVQLNGGFSRGRNDTFCFEHKTGFSGGSYKITDIVEIDGRTAKSVGTGKTAVKRANVIMNYILFKGNYRREMYLKDGSNKMSSRNIAIWSYQNTWINALGNGFLKNNWKNESTRYNIGDNFDHQETQAKNEAIKLRQEAIDFSKNTKGEASISITGAKTVNEYATNTYGPFKAKFTGDNVSLTVTGANGTIASNKIKIYSDKACTKSLSNIKSNGNFYIKVTDGTKIKNVTVNVSSTVLSAKIFFLAKNDFWSGHGQGIILIKPGERVDIKSVTFGTSTKGSLTIKKINKDTKKALKAGFKVQTSAGNWLSGKNGSYNYNNSFAGAEVYTSTITLNNLNFDTYRIYEVKAPSGYVLEDQAGYDKTNKWIYFGTATVNASNAKVTKTFTNEKTRGKITITKIDQQTKKALAAGFKIQTSTGKWLSGNNGSYNYENDVKNAQVYKSPITLKDLKFGTYRIYEVTPPKNGYELSAQKGYDQKNNWVDFGTATINKNTAKVTKTFTNKKTEKGNLTIKKVDKDTNKEISAGFKIRTSEGWLSGTNGSYNYKNDVKNAQIYPSTITLKDLKYGTYRVYEVTPPNGYDLSAQKGYDKTNNWVDFGTAVINSKNINVTKTYSNMQKISIKGYVWIDTQTVKDGEFNSLYDNTRESTEVAGVIVKLVKKSNQKAIATTKTNANGEYLFDKLITKSQLKDYYVEFNYNGVKAKYKDYENKDIEEDISKYIPVAFNSVNVNDIKKEGSRAMMDSVATEDTKLSGIATTYKGTDKETTYGLSGNLYNKLMEGSVLNNINLGIKKIPEADYNLRESLEYVKITIKGNTYTYNYGVAGKANYIAAPTVNWQKAGTTSSYTANIYPSDIVYNSNKSEENLQVNVGYRIDITNTTTTGTGDAANNYNELYKEKALHISSLTDTFDDKRYTLNDSNWKVEGNVAKYQKNIADIGSNKTATIKIKFSVNRKAIEDILEHPYGIIEKYPTAAKTTGYHLYTRKDYSWKNNIIKTQTHRTKDDLNEASAPYLIFKLGQERIIKGRVFEDKVVTTNGEKLGNGIYDNGEKPVSGVKVELLDIQGNITNINTLSIEDLKNLKASTLYRVKDVGTNNKKAIMSTAMVTTGDNGEYEFRGIVPGQYFLKFTYGNGKQEITDLDGNKVEKEWNSKIDGKEINIRDYKSTIIAQDKKDLIEKALTNAKDLQWYKKLGDNYSVALDNLATRIGVNNDNTAKNIMAGTAKLEITVENDANKTAITGTQKVTDNPETLYDGETSAQTKVEYLNEVTALNEFGGLNLGIIEMPKQEAKLEKIITNIKVINSDETTIKFNGNPAKDHMAGVSDLDDSDSKEGSSYVRAEILDETIYGSTIELTYSIKVTNISDVNYYNNKYYWFGEADQNKEVTIQVSELMDYLDETLLYNKDASTSKFEEIQVDPNLTEDETIAKKTHLKLSNWNAKLYTINNKNRNSSKNVQTSNTASIVAHRKLSEDSEDLELINIAKVSNVKIATDDNDRSSEKEVEIQTTKPEIFNYETQAKATVTPPTGADRQTIIIYTIAGVVALAMLSAGVVVIKKYAVK